MQRGKVRGAISSAQVEKMTDLFFIIIVAIVFLCLFLLLPVGESGFFLPHLYLNRVHLLQEFRMPYFTPGLCGGFLLAANPQSPIFSLAQAVSLAVSNVALATAVSQVLATLIFGIGLYKWFWWFGIHHRAARKFGVLTIVLSGYWISKCVQIPVQSLAFIPWLMHWIEKTLVEFKSPRAFKYSSSLLQAVTLLFLLFNQGHYWPIVFLFVVSSRFIVELLMVRDGRYKFVFQTAGFLAVSVTFALIMSMPRLIGTFAFALKNFSRDPAAWQIVGSFPLLFEKIAKGFFDSRVLTQSVTDPMLGNASEYTNYVGMITIPILVLGLWNIKNGIIRQGGGRALTALLLAAFCQVILTRTTHAVDLLRFFFPFLSQMYNFWRGSIIYTLCYGLLVCCGYQYLLQKRPAISLIAVLFVSLHCINVLYVYHHMPNFLSVKSSPFLAVDESPKISMCDQHHLFGCYDPILGYSNEFWKTQTVGGSVYGAVESNYYNMNDIKKMFGGNEEKGYFKTAAWPLWPKSDAEDFEKFVHFKQVMPLPAYFRWVGLISSFFWGVYFFALVFFAVRKSALLLRSP